DGLAPVLYPGSPQGMDPGEPGCHGAWIVELRAGEAPVATQLPLATVRYETVELDLDGLGDAGEIEGRAVAAVRERLHALAAERGPLRWLSVRLRVTGRTSLRREIERRLDQLGDDPIVEVDGVSAHVERVAVEVRPAHDLTALATTNDAPGLLARLLLALEHDELDAGQARLLADTRARMTAVRGAKSYRTLDAPSVLDEDRLARATLARQATRLLDELLTARSA
ncbi:MAG TPA: hypothetical protein VFX39_06950, partial [Gemmatimonadaceae bacterium]|nr:hypothetical protein [Gemmatimonadaceae bacterium]